MFYRNKIRTFTKSKSFSNISLSFFFILTFLLIIFNKTDYVLVNKLKAISVDVVSPITKTITIPVKVTADVIKTYSNIRFLKQENLRLKEEVVRLKKWQTLAIKNQMENNAYKKLLNSTSNKLNLIKTASVISQSPGIYAKMIIINAGFEDGISTDLSVINDRGLVGKVVSTSKNNSKIILINDQNSSVPIKNLSNNFFAIITGTSEGKYLSSSFIKDNNIPKVGDLLLTSGSAKIFPKDILVGKVVSVNEDNFLVLPYVDFNNLNYVQIINFE